MSWKIFLSPNTPPLVDPESINVHALSRHNLSSKRAKRDEVQTESDQQKRSRVCSISNMFLKEPSEHDRDTDTPALTQINETLKDIKMLTIEGNSTMQRFLELMEKRSSEKTQQKSRGVRTSRDNKSTVKKGKLASQQKLQERINSKIREFDRVKKSLEAHINLSRRRTKSRAK